MSEDTTRPLQLLAEAPLNAKQIARLWAIEKYDLWFVTERIAKEGSIDQHRIDEAVSEFRKYMALISLGYQDLGMHSKEVDEVWHSFILFTTEYIDFCQKACGQMIHHRPNTSRRPQLSMSSVQVFKDAYKRFFGPLPPIWFTESQLANREVLSGDCDVTQAPPCKGVLRTECDTADGGGQCQGCEGSMPTDESLTQFAAQPQ